MNARRSARVLLGYALCCVTAACPARADSPPQAPTLQKVFSANQKFYVLVDPARKVTTVYQDRGARPLKQWEMAGYFPVPALSDDGRYLVVLHPDGNLLSLDYRPDDIMFSIYDRGRIVRHVRLDELLPNPRLLTRTDSHYLWAISFGFEKGHHFHVETVDHRVQTFDVVTGERVPPARPRRRGHFRSRRTILLPSPSARARIDTSAGT